MENSAKRKHRIGLILSVLVLVGTPLLRPLGMSLSQGITLGLLIAAILWWATGAVGQTVASLLLLAGFSLCSGVPLQKVFAFPLSENFVLIAVSFLFSQGIVNSGLARRLLEPLLERSARSAPRLLLAMILCSFTAALFVPQSISRTFIVASLFSGYLDRCRVSEQTRSVLMFGMFFTGILVGLLFPRGDIVLNYSLLSISKIALTEMEWIAYLAPPTLCVLLCASLLYLFLFHKELQGYHPANQAENSSVPLTMREKGSLLLITATVLLWAAEPLHGISGTVIVCLGTVLMFPAGLLRLQDLKVLDVNVLLFLTAAFSIGNVITESGLAGLLFQGFGELLPLVFSWRYALAVLLCTMGMHMVLGSNVTTLAVALPILMTVSEGRVPERIVPLLVYVAVSQHFLLPFHHVTLAAGVGKGYFNGSQVLRFGLPMTLLVLMGGVIVYLNWWNLLGILG